MLGTAMTNRNKFRRNVIVGGVTAVGAGALLGTMLLTPASANGTSTNSKTDGNSHRNGDMGRRQMGAPRIGEMVHSSRLVQNADGSYSTVREQAGTVSAVTGTTITVTSADTYSVTYTPNSTATIFRDGTAATLADIVVGDHIRISGTVTNDVLTVVDIDAISATKWAEHEAAEADGAPDGRGPGGPGKGHHPFGGGAEVSGETVVQKADGTFVTVREQSGEVTAKTSTTITVTSTDGTVVAYTPDSTAIINRDRTTATLADVVVGDHARINGTVVGGVVTVTSIDLVNATDWATMKADRAADGSVDLPGMGRHHRDAMGKGAMGHRGMGHRGMGRGPANGPANSNSSPMEMNS